MRHLTPKWQPTTKYGVDQHQKLNLRRRVVAFGQDDQVALPHLTECIDHSLFGKKHADEERDGPFLKMMKLKNIDGPKVILRLVLDISSTDHRPAKLRRQRKEGSRTEWPNPIIASPMVYKAPVHPKREYIFQP